MHSMAGAFSSFITNHQLKRQIIPTNIFTDTCRKGYYEKMEVKEIYSLANTYHWLSVVNSKFKRGS